MSSEAAPLAAENLQIRRDIAAAAEELDALRESLKHRAAEVEEIRRAISAQKSTNGETVSKLRAAYSELSELHVANAEREKRLDAAVEDATQLVLSVVVAQIDLEEKLERKEREWDLLRSRVLKRIEKTRKLVCEESVDDEDFESIQDEAMEAMIRPFLHELRRIEGEFRVPADDCAPLMPILIFD